ncbi:Mu transposase C-terminal domain-containing protein [Marinigracilibium pacificum]|uniref:DDE-type integrase/transposase/recombinase n=1 Tax=Marinigracilibium pacificum TaxID=2729599 RepID=A0A848J7A2_9BACT|nr:Mu transposase C-terminal domain-containing protein [Marinigracilibium pacificum]NMM50314.1 DDE-type integrase/transposase/recombinase [Marinigracilibium pacificum]
MERLNIYKGAKVSFRNKPAIILRIINLEEVTIEEVDSSVIRTVHLSELASISKENNISESSTPIDLLSEKRSIMAKKRFNIIEPILSDRQNFSLIKEIAEKHNVHFTTIYRWIKIYDNSKTISSLAGKVRSGGRGKSRLAIHVDEIIKDAVEELYLRSSKKSINRVIRKVISECKRLEYDPPHPNTIRNRIKSVPAEVKIRKRHGASAHRDKFQPIKGSFPGADFPLSIVQIDHTKLDVILVDEHYRKPYLRPWITVAIDVYSRMVLGFYLSFDPPGEIGTGMCIAKSILPKEKWLQKYNLKTTWPCWGIMKTIHLDNAKEFKGKMLKNACENYGINVSYRPVKRPNWGGHVERLLGTLSKEIHDLPGTTFSDPKLRENYNSEKNAALTISELEKWLLMYITEIYHKRIHSSIRCSPIEKFEEGILGTENKIGVGHYPRIKNERRLILDFMPFFERTIQEYGVVIDHIHYYDEVLRRYIHSEKNGLKRKFIFKRDPRDISTIYFYDPEFEEYFDIPYRDTSNPPISVWEYNSIIKSLDQQRIDIDEAKIFEAYSLMEEIELEAIKQTKRLKRTSRYADKRDIINAEIEKENEPEEKISLSNFAKKRDIKPFDDIDYGSFKL